MGEIDRYGAGRVAGIPRRLLVLTSVFVLSACLAFPIGNKNAQRQEQRVLSRKVVSDKQEPNILWAADRTRCEVDQKKFESAKVGDTVWCVWTK